MLYDFPLKGGGSGAYVEYLAKRLLDTKRYEVGVASPDKHIIDPRLQHFFLKLPQVPVFIGRPGLERSKRYSQLSASEIATLYASFIQEALRVVGEFRPEVIHVHHMMVNAWVANFIRSVYGIHYILTCHGSDLFAIMQDKRFFRLTREAMRGADAITAVSGDTRSKLLKLFGGEFRGKTRTIPGGIRASMFPEIMPPRTRQKIVSLYGLPSSKIALFTGRLISEKGVEYLIMAASKIHGHVVIAGDGPQKKILALMIKERKITNVTLLGQIDYEALIKLYYVADVFISPSVWDEPLGLTIIEAMAAGKPVVVTRRGGVTMAVKDGVNGFFVRSRNATDIASEVNKLFANPALAEKMGRKAREVVLKRFTWAEIAKRFEPVYRRASY